MTASPMIHRETAKSGLLGLFRMQSAKDTETKFTPGAPFDLEAVLRDSLGVHTGGEVAHVELLFKALRRRLGPRTRLAFRGGIRELEDGRLRFTMDVAMKPELERASGSGELVARSSRPRWVLMAKVIPTDKPKHLRHCRFTSECRSIRPQNCGIPMSEIDLRSLEANFKKWQTERAPEVTESDAFELYALAQILKDNDLSDEEIASGNFGGGDDGGIDGMYLFINRQLMLEETPSPESAVTVELVIAQAKFQNGFKEDVIQKLESFSQDLFDWSKPIKALTYLSADVRDAIAHFRKRFDDVLASSPSLQVSFHYAAKSIHAPHPKLFARIENLKNYIRTQASAANVTFTFWDCAKMLESVRSAPKEEGVLEITNSFSTADGSVVCLVKLENFARFLTDEHGRLKTAILEPNVRDYQGKGNIVNKAIRQTLENSSSPEEFWWLNNGITVIAESCPITGNKIVIRRPEIVNGLQTSHEVYEVFRANRDRRDGRHVLVRVIIPSEERSRNSIIKATNSQSPVSQVSLRATDRIHFDIEDALNLHGLFYDRRKGEYKRKNKPIAKIVSIQALAQAVIAALLQRPSQARGGPQRLLNDEGTYSLIFANTHPRSFFVACILLDRAVWSFVSGHPALTRTNRVDIRYYVTMLAAAYIAKKAAPAVGDFVDGLDAFKHPAAVEIAEAFNLAFSAYMRLGGSDLVAKGPQLESALKEHLVIRFGATPSGPMTTL